MQKDTCLNEKNKKQKDTCTQMLIVALLSIAKTRKQSRCPLTNEWIKMQYMYAMDYYSAIKRNDRMPFAAT